MAGPSDRPEQVVIDEQQETELEVLESIFAEDLVRLPPPHAWGNAWHPTEFAIVLRPHEEALRANVSVVLRVRFTKTYPWSKPDISVPATAPPALAARHPEPIRGLDAATLARLEHLLQKQLASLPLGAEMVFELATAAQDFISEHHSLAEVQMRHPQLQSLSQFMEVRTAEELEQQEQADLQQRLQQEQQEIEHRKFIAHRIAQEQGRRRTSTVSNGASSALPGAPASNLTSKSDSIPAKTEPFVPPRPRVQADSLESTLHAGTHLVSAHVRHESFLETLTYRDVQTHAVQVGPAIEATSLCTTYHVTPVSLGSSTPIPPALRPPSGPHNLSHGAMNLYADVFYSAQDAIPDMYTWDMREYILSSPFYTANPMGKKTLEEVEAQLDTLKSIHSKYLLNVIASSLTRRPCDSPFSECVSTSFSRGRGDTNEPMPWQLVVISERPDVTSSMAGHGGVTTLDTLLDLTGTLPWSKVRPLALSLLHAVEVLHDNGLVHGAVRSELCWISKREKYGERLDSEDTDDEDVDSVDYTWADLRLDTPTFRSKLESMNRQHPFRLPTKSEPDSASFPSHELQPVGQRGGKRRFQDKWIPPDALALSRSQDMYSLGILLCKTLFGKNVTRKYESPSALLLQPSVTSSVVSPEVCSFLMGLLHEHPRKRPSAKRAISQLSEVHQLTRNVSSSSHELVPSRKDKVTEFPQTIPIPQSNLAWGLPSGTLASLPPIIKGLGGPEALPPSSVLGSSPQTRPGAFWPMIRPPIQRTLSPPPATRPVSRYEADFEELQFLGKGAFGSVVRARNILDGRQYAIKKIRLSNMPFHRGNLDQGFFNRRNNEDDKTLREVQALSRLNHPRVIRYVTCWIEDQVVAFRDPTSTIASSTDASQNNVSGALSLSRPDAVGGPLNRKNQSLQIDTFTSSRSLPRPAREHRLTSGPAYPNRQGDESDFLSVGHDAFSRSQAKSEGSDDIQFGWDDASMPTPRQVIQEASDEEELEEDEESDSDSSSGTSSSAESLDDSESSHGLFIKPRPSPSPRHHRAAHARSSSDAHSDSTASPSNSRALVRPSVPEKEDSLLRIAPRFSGTGEELLSSQGEIESAVKEPRMVTRRTLFIQMEFISGPTLRSAIDDGLSRDECWALLRQMLEALTHINLTMGIIHRDLKPSNVFMGPDRKIKVGDFGLATTATSRFADDDTAEEEEDDSRLEPRMEGSTDLTTDVGTNLYIAPEVESGGSYNAKVDMYSLGVLFFEMLASSAQVYKTGMERVLTIKALREHLTLPQAWPFGPDEAETRVVRWLLQHSPDARPTPLQLLRSKLLPDEDLEDEFVEEFLRMGTNPQSAHHDRLLATMFDGQLFGPDTGQGRTMDEEVSDMARDSKYEDSAGRETESPLYNLVADSLRSLFRRHGAVQTSVPPLVPPNEFYNPPGSFTHIFKQPLLPTSVGLDTSLVGTDPAGPSNSMSHGTVHNKLVRLLDRGGRLVYLPYDNILPFARMFMQSRQHPRYKRFDVRGVYRANPEPTRQPVEVGEANFDIISPVRWAGAEAETFSVLQAILEQIPGLSKGSIPSSGWTIQLNHSTILEAVLKTILPAQGAIHRQAVLSTVGSTLGMRLRQTDRTRVRARLKQLGLTTSVIEELERLNVSTSIEEAEKVLVEHMPKSIRRDLVGPLQELHQIRQLSQAFGVTLPLMVTPLLARNVAYYKAGSIFQLTRPVNRRLEVLAAGGRYDSLLSRFAPNERFLHLDPLSATMRSDTGAPEHGVGIEISVGKIALELQNWQEVHVSRWASRALEEERSFGAWTARRCDVYVISPPGAVLARIGLVRDLWAAGIAADLKYDAMASGGKATALDDDEWDWDTYDVDPTTGHYSPERILRTCKAEGIGFLVHVRSRGDVVKVRNVLHKTEIEVERDEVVSHLLQLLNRQRTVDLATVNSSLSSCCQDSVQAAVSLAGTVASGALSGLGRSGALLSTAATTGHVAQTAESRWDQVDTHVVFPPGPAARGGSGGAGRESRHKERRLQRQGRATWEDKAARDAVTALDQLVKGHIPVLVLDLPWNDLARLALQDELPVLEREVPRGAAGEYTRAIRARLAELRVQLRRARPEPPHKILFYSIRDERCLLV